MARPQDVRAAKIMADPKTRPVVPAGEIALALEQFRRLQTVTLGWQTVGGSLVVGIFDFIRAPTDGAFREHYFQIRKAVEHASKQKIRHHRDRADGTNHIAE